MYHQGKQLVVTAYRTDIEAEAQHGHLLAFASHDFLKTLLHASLVHVNVELQCLERRGLAPVILIGVTFAGLDYGVRIEDGRILRSEAVTIVPVLHFLVVHVVFRTQALYFRLCKANIPCQHVCIGH